MKRTISLIAVVAMLFTMIPAFGVTAAEAGERVYLTVTNGDFEQSQEVDISEYNYTSDIPGWDVEYYPAKLNNTPSDILFHQIINGGSGNNSKVAHVYDFCDSNTQGDHLKAQIVLATEYIALSPLGKTTELDYTVDFKYIAPTYDTSGGADLYHDTDYGSRFRVGFVFYNDSNEYYKSGTWTPAAGGDTPLNTEYQANYEILEWKNDGKDTWPIKPGEWGDFQLEQKAPVGATKAKVFFIADANNKSEFAVDDIKLSYIQPEVEVSGAEVTNGDFEADAPGRNGTITGWTATVAPATEYSDILYYEIKEDEGDQSLYIYDNDKYTALAVTSDKIPVVPGNQYQFTFNYKTSRGIPTSVNFYNAEGKVYKFATQEWMDPEGGDNYGMPDGIAANVVLNEGSKTSYTMLSTENYTAPKDAASVAITFYGTSARNKYLIHVDDVAIVETPGVADTTPPADVSNAEIKAGNGKIDISFTEPADADYTMTKLYVDGVMTAIFNKGGAQEEYTLSGLTNEQAYEIKLVAYDSSNNGSAGVTETVTPKAPEQNTPPTVTKPIGNTTIWGDETLRIDLSSYFTDVDEDALTFTADKGTVSGSDFSYLPSAEDIEAGSVQLNITANDGNGGSVTDTITVTIQPVPNEKPEDTDTTAYLNVKNPGFERTEAGTKNTALLGWTPQFTSDSDKGYSDQKYFEIIEDTADPSKGNVLHIVKTESNTGLILGSDLIEVPDYNSVDKKAYTMTLDYYINSSNGSISMAMAFYNEQGQLWSGASSSWVAAGNYNNDHQVLDAEGQVNRINKRKSDNPSEVVEKEWSSLSLTRTAPKDTKYIRLFLYGYHGWGSVDNHQDNVTLSYEIEKSNLTVTKTGEGTVSPDGTTQVITGSTQTITATPAEGWEISKILVNNVEQPIKETFNVTVKEDTTVAVTFSEKTASAPTVTTFKMPYIPTDLSGSYTFGSVSEGYKSTVKEFGIVYSATDSASPEIGKDGCYQLKAEKELSVNGHYGIAIQGDLLKGTTYYTRTYVIYTDEGGTEHTVYGDVQTINLAE